MAKHIIDHLQIPGVVGIVLSYCEDPLKEIRPAIMNETKNNQNICSRCGEFMYNCGCSAFYNSQFELKMRREQVYCFGCPGANLPPSDFEQECTICGLTTY